MILVYHKVDLFSLTKWYVTVDAFDRQMAALASREVVDLDSYDPYDPKHAVVTFDGVYENVWRYAFPILRKWGYPFELFVIGDYIGEENTFDQHVEPPCRFASMDQLADMTLGGGRVQWHTRSHPRLDERSLDEVAGELEVPGELARAFPDPHLAWFAYPHDAGRAEISDLVRTRFRGALACEAGDAADRHRLSRTTMFEETELQRARVTLVVANYNYGGYLREAMDSVLRQTSAPDEIILIDDASTDGSELIMEEYRDAARLVRNQRNLGIVGNFRKAVDLATGDYVAFLGADNRIRADFVELCRAALDRNPEAGVAYTDIAIFGDLAAILAAQIGAAPTSAPGVFRWSFPDPTPEALERADRKNIFHGSSMFRRAAYDQVGGYRKAEVAEDHDLFRRIVAAGWGATRVAEPVLEYRQHSLDQANTRLNLELLVARQHHEIQDLKRRLVEQRAAVERRRTADDASALRLKLISGAVSLPLVELDSPIPLNDPAASDRFLKQGWCGAERWGRWSLRDCASFEFIVDAPERSDVEFALTGAPYWRQGQETVTVTVVASNRVVGVWSYSRNEPVERTVVISGTSLRDDPRLTIALHTPDYRKPEEALSSDKRPLAFRAVNLVLRVASIAA